MDSYIGEFYADPEPPKGQQPYVHEPEAVSVRVEDEDEHAPSVGDGTKLSTT